MWGASVYLEEAFKLPEKEAGEILSNWIDNYSALNEKYEWDNPPIKKD